MKSKNHNTTNYSNTYLKIQTLYQEYSNNRILNNLLVLMQLFRSPDLLD